MALPKKIKLPTHLDLPVEDGIPMEDRLHPVQAMDYLRTPLKLWMTAHGWKAVMGHNTFIYYESSGDPVGPDFWVVNDGVERGQGSWVVWDEGGRYPTLIVELVSPSSKKKDRVTNFEIYQNTFRTPDYFIYDLREQALEGFRLVKGRYMAVKPDASGMMSCTSLPLKLGITDPWLRWFTTQGALLPTPDELATQEHGRAEAERKRAEAERKRAVAERKRAEAECKRAEAERKRAESERMRAESAERRIQEMEQKLRDLDR